MTHKSHHHKMFITLIVLLVAGIGFIMSQMIRTSNADVVQTIMLFVNTIFLAIILHFLLEIYSGNHVLQVVDVTPKPIVEQVRVAAAPKRKATKKKTSRKKTAKKKTARKRK